MLLLERHSHGFQLRLGPMRRCVRRVRLARGPVWLSARREVQTAQNEHDCEQPCRTCASAQCHRIAPLW